MPGVSEASLTEWCIRFKRVAVIVANVDTLSKQQGFWVEELNKAVSQIDDIAERGAGGGGHCGRSRAAVKAQRPLGASADAHARHHERGGRAWRLIAPARHPVDEVAIHGN
jgi:hypothetical protein